jgi:hypothetical protein
MILMYCFNLESNNILDIRVSLLQGDACWEMNDYTGLNIPEHRFFKVGERGGLTLYSAELEPDEMAQVESSTLLRDAIFENDWPWEDLGMVLHVLAERGKRKWPG